MVGDLHGIYVPGYGPLGEDTVVTAILGITNEQKRQLMEAAAQYSVDREKFDKDRQGISPKERNKELHFVDRQQKEEDSRAGRGDT